MKKLLGFSAVTLLIAAGCGNVKDAVTQTFNEPALMGTWESKCNGSKLTGLSERTFVKFNGAAFERTQAFYNGGDCDASKPANEKAPAVEAKYQGTFLLNNSTIPENGAKFIDIKYEKAKLVAKTDEGVKVLNDLKVCGHENYVANREVDLTSQSAGGTCPLQTAPAVAYEIYKVDGNAKTLMFSSKGWFSGRGETASDRSKELDSKNVYGPSQHAF
jgi:hypothetical protein